MLGNNIKTARKRLKITQKELATRLGIAEITIRKYENGDREPNLETIEKLATALEVTPYELLGGASPTMTSEDKHITSINKNLTLLTQSSDPTIKELNLNLDLLIENITANTLNRYNVPSAQHEKNDYVMLVNQLLDKMALLSNPVQHINTPSHTRLLKEINDYIRFKINQFQEEED